MIMTICMWAPSEIGFYSMFVMFCKGCGDSDCCTNPIILAARTNWLFHIWLSELLVIHVGAEWWQILQILCFENDDDDDDDDDVYIYDVMINNLLN